MFEKSTATSVEHFVTFVFFVVDPCCETRLTVTAWPTPLLSFALQVEDGVMGLGHREPRRHT